MVRNRSHEVIIRMARPSDRNQILAFTRNTFSWGDYLDQTWDDWVDGRDGRLLVAQVGGKSVGIVHVRLMGKREAWCEGMRVHPDYRKKGVASSLNAQALDFARRAGCRIARLETSSSNFPAQSAIASLGYRFVFRLREWGSKSAANRTRFTRVAEALDLGQIAALWQHSRSPQASKFLIPIGDPWHWAAFDKVRIRSAVMKGEVWVTPARGKLRGFALVAEGDEGLEMMLLVGRAREARNLLIDLKSAADQRGQPKTYLILPETGRTDAWARSAGFAPTDADLLLYEYKIH